MADGDVTTDELYKDRPDFADVTPIYNSEAENSVVPIALRTDFVDAFAYLRALMNAKEISERAFELTTTCARMNPANYSVWEYRRHVLRGLNKDLKKELEFCEEMILENLKNYQVWHHRRELIQWMKEERGSMSFVDVVLKDDFKNYHAWQHRVFLARHYKVPLKSELKFTTDFISRDVFNNSAWTYRYFVVAEMSDDFDKKDVVNEEIKFVMNHIRGAVNNASSWAYLSGLMEFSSYADHPEVVEFTKKMLIPADAPEGSNLVVEKSAPNSFALAFLADAMIAVIEEKNPVNGGLQLAKACYERLVVVDPLRRRLWNYKLHELQNLANV
uniref:Protein farnesyltransferase/geranylgeranyltransferase type-1 subunit alpha n=1 Tax=Panagrolaimus sp. JU765 TaxID=591449 RepID=A0AC34Q066_9BILA